MAESASTITHPLRRQFLRGAVVSAIAGVAVGKAAVSPVADPLMTAIKGWRDGLKVYSAIPETDWDALGGEDVVVENTYGNKHDILADWAGPATSRQSALEALRIAIEDNAEMATSPLVGPMIAAALAYFEAEDRKSRS